LFTSAPWPSSAFTTCWWPSWAARIRAVVPGEEGEEGDGGEKETSEEGLRMATQPFT
jgi:hypothetical protein